MNHLNDRSSIDLYSWNILKEAGLIHWDEDGMLFASKIFEILKEYLRSVLFYLIKSIRNCLNPLHS